MQSQSKSTKTHKHSCPDCKMCQGCSEARCRACRGSGAPHSERKLSIQEQIALFNSLNPGIDKKTVGCRCRAEENE